LELIQIEFIHFILEGKSPEFKNKTEANKWCKDFVKEKDFIPKEKEQDFLDQAKQEDFIETKGEKPKKKKNKNNIFQ
jgi:hypothetical protein